DMQMIRQGLAALDQKPQEPLEGDAHRTTDAPYRNPLHQQAFDETTLVRRNEVLLAAVDELASTTVAVMMLFPVVNVPIFLVLRGLASRAHVSDNHGLLLTSNGVISFWVNRTTETGGRAFHGPHYRSDRGLGAPSWVFQGGFSMHTQHTQKPQGVRRRELLRAGLAAGVTLSAWPLSRPPALWGAEAGQPKRGGILRVRGWDPPHFDPHLTISN